MTNQRARKSAIRRRMAETGLNYTGAMRQMDAEDAAKSAESAVAKDAPDGSPLDLRFSSGDAAEQSNGSNSPPQASDS